ncbi:MAG: Holliday junction resolvase RuvX [Planctomycetes bacterium]|jgi:putative Holliday junction resolvase|nr:Holliday junction resolvase RuvX [Planctomycetota bacterium]
MPGVLAIDHGERKSGFAYSDAARILCNALDPAQAGGTSTELYDHLRGLLEEHDVGTLLVGLPLAPVAGSASTSPSDRLGERARSVLRFADGLRKRFPELEICLYDEHLTTKEAESRLTEAGYRGPDRKARLDSWSALVLLEDWLAAGEPR